MSFIGGLTVRPQHSLTNWHFETADLSDCIIEAPPMAGMVFAPDIWNRIIASAHKYAEPGIIFIDEVNRHNHMMASMGPIYACNPCGEQQLHFNNSCNLGSIDVAKFFKVIDGTGTIDWDRLSHTTHLCTQFLDNVVDAGYFPLPEIDDVVKANTARRARDNGIRGPVLEAGSDLRQRRFDHLDGKGNGICPPRGLDGVASFGIGKGTISGT